MNTICAEHSYARLKSQFIKSNKPLDLFEFMHGTSDDTNISEWILYSNENHYGSAGLHYEYILDAVSKVFHGGFYICLSSIIKIIE